MRLKLTPPDTPMALSIPDPISGRVADWATIAALGWRGGDWLTLTPRPK